MNFLLQMRPAVEFEDFGVEVLDTEAEPRHAHFTQRFEFVLLQRARFALERHFLGTIPRQHFPQTPHEAAQLRRTQIRRGATPEVDVLQRPAADQGHPAVKRHFLDERVEIGFDIAGVLVGVNAKIAEFAAFAAKRNMQVQPQRRVGFGGGVQRGPRVG